MKTPVIALEPHTIPVGLHLYQFDLQISFLPVRSHQEIWVFMNFRQTFFLSRQKENVGKKIQLRDFRWSEEI